MTLSINGGKPISAGTDPRHKVRVVGTKKATASFTHSLTLP